MKTIKKIFNKIISKIVNFYKGIVTKYMFRLLVDELKETSIGEKYKDFTFKYWDLDNNQYSISIYHKGEFLFGRFYTELSSRKQVEEKAAKVLQRYRNQVKMNEMDWGKNDGVDCEL